MVREAAMTQQVTDDACVIWFTGLSGAGKTTLAKAVHEALTRRGMASVVLDGDQLRGGLCHDLGFSAADRTENIRRIGEVAALMRAAGLMVLVACISPRAADRDRARGCVPADRFLEVHCACPLSACESRDVKGLYARARQGLVPDFTGISSPYEAPLQPELTLDSSCQTVDECTSRVLGLLGA